MCALSTLMKLAVIAMKQIMFWNKKQYPITSAGAITRFTNVYDNKTIEH